MRPGEVPGVAVGPEPGGAGEHVTARRDRGELHGILNGIDENVWDPAADPHVRPYAADGSLPVATASDVATGKARNRRVLLREFGLDKPAGPLAVVVEED